MKKILLLSLTFLLFFSLLATAKPVAAKTPKFDVVTILGHVKGPDGKPFGSANIQVTCRQTTKNTMTGPFGNYLVFFPGSSCDEGDQVTVVATKNGMSGSGSGIVRQRRCFFDIAIINISVPEFGMITGVVVFITSLGAFITLRKRI